jgi:hypothetical protein
MIDDWLVYVNILPIDHTFEFFNNLWIFSIQALGPLGPWTFPGLRELRVPSPN